MHSNTAVQFLPSICDNTKVDVAIENDEAVIKLSTFTEGLGWTCQKTMRLESSLLDDLHRAISAARYRLNTQKADNTVSAASNIIAFPKVA